MPDPVSAAITGVATIGGSLVKSSAAKKASAAQQQAAQAGIEETRAAREELRALLAPYTEAGPQALEAQMAIAGLDGTDAQQKAVTQIEQSPIFQAMLAQGEGSILQNASATGGLRGGNVQGALAQFSPAMLNQFIEQQYGRLGGLTTLGQNSAAGTGAAGQTAASSIAKLLEQQGAAKAGGNLAQGSIFSDLIGQAGGGLTKAISAGLF